MASIPQRNKRLAAFSVFLAVTALLSATALAAPKTRAAVTANGAVVYKQASANSDTLVQLPRGEEVSVEEWNDEGFCHISIGSGSGYIKSTQLKKIAISEKYSPAKRGKINADSVNLRTRWDTDSSIICVMKKHAQVEVLGRSDNWYKVSSGVNVGYIDAQYIDVDTDSAGESAVTLRMGMSGNEVARLQQALADMGYFKGDVNGSFGARTRDAVKAFQLAKDLTVDGVADPATLELLYATQAR